MPLQTQNSCGPERGVSLIEVKSSEFVFTPLFIYFFHMIVLSTPDVEGLEMALAPQFC